MTINLIAAAGHQGQIGLNGALPWQDAEDLRWFKRMTMGGVVVVGHRTAKGLPPLPGRLVYAMGRGETPAEALEVIGDRDVWIAGGAATYRLWMPLVQRFYLARIDYSGPADTYLPSLPWCGR